MGKLLCLLGAIGWTVATVGQTAPSNSEAYRQLAETSCVSLATSMLRPRSNNALNQKILKAKSSWEKKSARTKDIAQKEKLFAEYRSAALEILKADAPLAYSQCETIVSVVDDCHKAHGVGTEAANRCISDGSKQRIEKLRELLTSALK